MNYTSLKAYYPTAGNRVKQFYTEDDFFLITDELDKQNTTLNMYV